MANDAFMKPEFPEPLRDLMKMSIEQARRAFDTFAASSEKAWKSLETTSQSARASLQQLNAKIAEITRANAEANFNLAMKLAECKDVSEAMELQSEHVRNQMDKFVHQLEEMRDLTTKIIQDANPAKTDIGPAPTQRNNASTTSSSSAHSYPSSGGYTPGGPRGY
jgi:phasin